MDLRACRPSVPLPAQEHIVKAAIRDALSVGLRLPMPVRVHWVEGRRGSTPRGTAERRTDGSSHVYLDVQLMPTEIREVMFHEAFHLADFATAAGRALSDEERDRRAQAFASRMMGWR